MTDQTQPEIPGAEDAVTPPKATVAWFLDDGKPVKADVASREGETSYPTKKAAAEAAAAPPPAPEKASRDGSYLPALPEGYSYTRVEIDGPDGTRLIVGSSVEGNFAVDVETEDFNRSTPYPSFGAAVRGAGERAKLLQKRTAALAAAKALEAEFGE